MNAFCKRRKRTWIMLLTMAFLLCFAFGVSGAPVQSKRVVRVACGINCSLYLDDDGNPEGYCASYLATLAGINHWQLEYVEGSFNESIQNLNNNAVDLLFPLQITPDREKQMAFSDISGGYQPICIYALADSETLYDDYETLDGSRIAVIEGSNNEKLLQNFAKEHSFSYTPVYIDSMEEKARATEAGSADYIAASNVEDAEKFKIIAVMSYEPFYYAVRKDDTQLLDELNQGMAQIMLDQPKAASNVMLNFLESGIQVAHTAEENEWIEHDGKIVVGLYQDTPPLYHMENEEEAHGIYVDLLQLLEQKTGATIELYPINRDTYAYDLLEDGTIDAVLGSNDTSLKALKNSDYVYTAPILDYTTVTISRHDYIHDEKEAPIYALTTARQYWEPLILQDTPNAQFQLYRTAKDCLVAVQEGKADITLLNAWEFNYQSKNARFSDLIEWENHRIYGDVVMVAMASTDSTMLSIMDKGIAELSSTEENEIIALNLNLQYDGYTFSDKMYTYGTIVLVSLIVVVLILAFFAVYVVMRKRYEHQLETQNSQLERANRAKSEFLANMSHDIRTPMNVIIGMSHLAKENDNPPDTEDCLDKIGVSGEFLLGLVNDALDMERVESGKINLSLEPYSGKEFSQYIEAVISPLCDQKNIKFEYLYQGISDFTVRQDKLRINQIYFNILSNATKFTPEGGTIRFATEAKRENGKIVFHVTISDTGIGMSEAFQKHMFEPFEQENQQVTSQGTGLGLSIVKRLCDMMDMRISVKSKLGEGTTFFLNGAYEEVPKEVQESKGEQEDAVVDPTVALSHKTILVCEDHPLNQEIIRRLLEKKEVNVVIAEDGKQGTVCFARSTPGQFDAVLMDIRMPVMNGLDAAKTIRSLPRADAKTIPIIALSANAYEEDIEKCRSAGMNTHLAKPINPDRLFAVLAEYMS